MGKRKSRTSREPEASKETEAEANVPAEGSTSWRTTVLAGVGVAALSAAVLLTGLGRYGLWDPPKDWKPTIKRLEGREADEKTKKSYLSRKVDHPPVSEIVLAQDARSRLEGKKKDKPKPEAISPTAPASEHMSRYRPVRRSLIAWGLSTFGVSEKGARLPLAMAGLLVVLLTFLLAVTLYDWKTGLGACLVLLSLPGFVLQARQLTSDMPLLCFLCLSALGFALLLRPSGKKGIRILGMLLALMGLFGGYKEAGAMLGILLPLTAALLATAAWFLRFKSSCTPTLRTGYWLGLALLLITTVALVVAAQMSLASAKGFSAFLGVEPRAAVQVLTFEGTSVPKTEPAVFDALLKDLGYAAFPWVAFLPMGLFLCLAIGRPKTAAGAEDPATRSRSNDGDGSDASMSNSMFADSYVVSWVIASLLFCTYWFLRFDNITYLGLFALAIACAVGIRRLRSAGSAALTGGLVLAMTILAILVRDFIDFPQALAQSNVFYQVSHPQEVGLKLFVATIGVLFGLGLLLSVLLLPERKPVAWPETFHSWLLAENEARQLERMGSWRMLEWAWVLLGGIPALVTAVFLGIGVIVKLLVYGLIVEPFLYTLFLVSEPFPRSRYALAKLLFPGKDRAFASELYAHLTGRAVMAKDHLPRFVVFAYWIAASIFVFPIWGIRVALRAFILIVILLFKAPSLVVLWAASRMKRPADPERARRSLGSVILLSIPCAAGLLFGIWIGHRLLPSLSLHYSHKAIFESYHRSKSKKKPEPLALYKMESRSAVFYNAGKIISQEEIQQTYRDTKARTDPLLGYFSSEGRVYAMVGASHLGWLDRQARRASVKYYVLDASSSWYLLISNRLGTKEQDHNPLLRYISHRPPSRIGRRLNIVFKEPHSRNEGGDVTLLGVEMPRTVYTGNKFPVTLHFKVTSDITGDWKIFIHFDGPGHRFHGDHDPLGGKFKTRFWSAGTYITDPYVVPSNHTSRVGTPSGIYQVWMGFFRGETRMKVLNGPKDNRIHIGTIEVLNPMTGGCSRGP